MAPARTFQEDPGYMILYHALTSILASTTEKPDYSTIASKTSLVSAAAAQKRLERLLKVQRDAEGDTATISTPASGTPKKAGKGDGVKSAATLKKAGRAAGKKEKDAKNGGDEEEKLDGEVKSTPKKRKVADMEDIKAEDSVVADDNLEMVKQETDE